MAHRQTLNDEKFRIICYVDTDNNGKKTILNERFHKFGYFGPGNAWRVIQISASKILCGGDSPALTPFVGLRLDRRYRAFLHTA